MGSRLVEEVLEAVAEEGVSVRSWWLRHTFGLHVSVPPPALYGVADAALRSTACSFLVERAGVRSAAGASHRLRWQCQRHE